MLDEKKLETMAGELKLLKSEVKESLVNVRDFLGTLKFPLPLRDLDGMDNQMGLQGGLTLVSGEPAPGQRPGGGGQQPQRESPPPAMREPPPAKPEPKGMNEPVAPPEAPKPREKPAPPAHMEKPPEDEPQESEPQDGNEEDKMRKEVAPGSSTQVNLLSNLIRWVSVARSEIGTEKLNTFLEIYATAGNLSAESKAVILHLAEVIVPPSGDGNAADVWSRLLLELHGILTGGGTSLRPMGTPPEPETEDEAAATEEKAARPVPAKSHQSARLKLVVPDGDNGEKEFDIEEFSVSLD